MNKNRLDRELVRRGLAADENQALRWIMAGIVVVADHRVDKPGQLVKTDADIRVNLKHSPYVSRGGMKLEAALRVFKVAVAGRTALDLGASTGGFTDCLLQHGAAKVFAVDVGTNQLDYRLRTHEKVVSLERTHAKTLNRKLVPERISLSVVDVSFTSLTHVLGYVFPLLDDHAEMICLFKPQFELPRELVGEGGIVRDLKAAEAALKDFQQWLTDCGCEVINTIQSPIKGREGNQEHLIHARYLRTSQ